MRMGKIASRYFLQTQKYVTLFFALIKETRTCKRMYVASNDINWPLSNFWIYTIFKLKETKGSLERWFVHVFSLQSATLQVQVSGLM